MFWIHDSRVFEKFIFAHVGERQCITKFCAFAAENYKLRIELVTPWGGMALLSIFF